jgi:hypothetical protein
VKPNNYVTVLENKSPKDSFACSSRSSCINRRLQIECGKNCPAGEKCQNNKLRLKKYAKIELKKQAIVKLDCLLPKTFPLEPQSSNT